MDQYPQHMKISELSAHAKIPMTTIRFYIHEGMLPPALKTSKTMAYYTQTHLERLLKIQKMKEKNFSLSTIKDILADNDGGQPVSEENNGMLMTSTREEISKVAVKLFREKGYDRITISDIAAEARIGKGTFYQYFRNKEDLFAECLESIFYDIGGDIPELQTETDGLRRMRLREEHFNHYAANILEMLSLARYKALMGTDQFKEQWRKVLFNFVEPIRKDLELIMQQRKSPLTNSMLVAYLYIGAVEYIYNYHFNSHADLKIISEAFWKFFFNVLPQQVKKEED